MMDEHPGLKTIESSYKHLLQRGLHQQSIIENAFSGTNFIWTEPGAQSLSTEAAKCALTLLLLLTGPPSVQRDGGYRVIGSWPLQKSKL